MTFSELRFINLVRFGLLRANFPSLPAITPAPADIQNGTYEVESISTNAKMTGQDAKAIILREVYGSAISARRPKVE